VAKKRASKTPAGLALDAARSARQAGETMTAAAAVIAARAEMAALACANPSIETGVEMNLMVSEKVVALSEAGATLARGATDMAGHGARYATEELSAAGRNALALAACRGPIEMFALQGRLMSEFVTRGMAFGLGLNALASDTGDKVMGPIHEAVAANAKRLKK
jgi:hypothetical protein